ncbi:MAG TPA: tetratricopeptide repeat protein [Candidatus Saccharimonadales bacterium]|nr:tetratricopeptide repeat protein [Candidatus Saccharimonadales bacterium]
MLTKTAGGLRLSMMPLVRKIALVAALGAGASSTLAQSPENPARAISSALGAKEYDKALELCRAALRAAPRNPQLWTLQGVAFASKGDSKEALVSFQRALRISPSNVAALAGAAQIEYQSGDQSAVPLLNKLVQLRPGDPTAHAMLAVLQYQKGDCRAAVGNFEKADVLLDSQLDALHAYATCLVKLRKIDAALATFQRAVALRPNEPQELQLLASIQIMAHKPQDALVTLHPLLDGKEPNANILQLASTAYEDTGDTPNAVSALRQALLLEPKNTSLYLDFANICFAHESFQVGIDVITEGLTLQKDADDLYVARGVLYVQLAQYDRAEADFEKAYELNPNQSLSSAAQGMASVQANDPDHALVSIQSKLARKPNDPLLLYLQADVLTQKGADAGTPEFQLAMRSAKKAVALQPTLGAAHGVLAKLYMQTGQYPEAIAQCRQALDIDSKDQAALYRLIQALRKTGQTRGLPELLKRLAELREQAAKDEKERYRYKLFEDESPARPSAEPQGPGI